MKLKHPCQALNGRSRFVLMLMGISYRYDFNGTKDIIHSLLSDTEEKSVSLSVNTEYQTSLDVDLSVNF